MIDAQCKYCINDKADDEEVCEECIDNDVEFHNSHVALVSNATLTPEKGGDDG